jgi:hypothetical protein
MKYYAFNETFNCCDLPEEEFLTLEKCQDYVNARNEELGGHYIVLEREKYEDLPSSKGTKVQAQTRQEFLASQKKHAYKH